MDNHAGRVRLEVDASDVTNALSNHSAQGGVTTGWVGETGVTLAAITNPTRAAETLIGAYTGGRTVRATYGGGATSSSRVLSPAVSVVAGEKLGVSFSVADSRVVVVGSELQAICGFAFYDAGSAEITAPGSTIFTSRASSIVLDVDAPWRMSERFSTVITAPADAVTARVFWRFYDDAGLSQKITRAVYLSKVMVVKSVGADASTVVAHVPFSDSVVWQDVLGSATSAQITRGGQVDGVTDDIDVGTLTATVTDPVVDPAQNPRMRRGRKVRFVALDDTSTWRSLFAGRVENLDVVYTDKQDPSARPRVTITAVDAVAELAKTGQPFGYGGGYGPKVKALMGLSSVPYVADAGAASASIVHLADRGRLWDQLVLARDTFSGARLWVDTAGVLQARTVTPTGVAEHEFHDRDARSFMNSLNNPSFESNVAGLSTDLTGVTFAQSAAWSEQGTKSALVSKSSPSDSVITVYAATPDGTQGIDIGPDEFFSVRVAVKAVIAFAYFGLRAKEFSGATSLGSSYMLTTSVAVSAGDVVVVESKHMRPTNPVADRVVLTLVSSTTASTGPMCYVDGWCVIKEGTRAAGWDTVPYADTTGAWAPIGTPYLDVDVRYGANSLVNELVIVAHNSAEPDGQKEYGPYRNGVSQADWGVAPAQVDAVDPSSPSALAESYLERFATPEIFPRSLKFRAVDADSDALFVDLYDECRVVHGPSGTDEVAPVIGIEHVITPRRWDVSLLFRPETATSVAVTNPAAGADTGPLDVDGPNGWQALPFATGWSAYGSGYAAPAYRVADGQVRVRGLVKNTSGAAVASASTVATLAAFAPSGHELFLQVSSASGSTGAQSAGTAHTHPYGSGSGYLRMQVNSDGTIVAQIDGGRTLPSNGWVSLSGIGWAVG